MEREKVLIINTGGTIGMVYDDPDNPLSPLRPGTWEEMTKNVPLLNNLPFDIHLYTFDPLLDSSCMKPKHWIQIAQIIEKNYDKYSGFVILHGTDTMCYTASALSFKLIHLGKPVIITGAQLSMVMPRSDALQNLITSLYIAAPKTMKLPIVPEVCIFFRDHLLRGNRSRKLSASGYEAFKSPNYPPLGVSGEHIKIDTKLLRPLPKPDQGELFYVDTMDIETNVMVLDIFPGINPEILRNIIKNSDSKSKIKALILKTYGTGNVPTGKENEDFLDVIKEITNSGILVVNITQCIEGMVELGLYETSSDLLDIGVISGLDMTPEAALTKLMVLLKKGWTLEEVARQMQINQCGEQSINIYNIDYESGSTNPIYKGTKMIPGEINFSRLERATLRFQEVELLEKNNTNNEVILKVYTNYPQLNFNTPENIPQFAGIIKRTLKTNQTKFNLFLDVTSNVKRFLNPGKYCTLSILSSEKQIQWKKLNLAIYTWV